MHKDLRKPVVESKFTEVRVVTEEILYAYDRLDSWATPASVSTDLAFKADKCFIRKEPLGVVLVIGSWNYPVQLLIAPVIGAIAAGNAVILKPSEVASNVASLLETLIPKYLDQNAYRVSVLASTCQFTVEIFSFTNINIPYR